MKPGHQQNNDTIEVELCGHPALFSFENIEWSEQRSEINISKFQEDGHLAGG